MVNFGWDYPPGCSSVPGDEPFVCEVCGGDPGLDCPDQPGSCICPECEVCGEFGDPSCYHGWPEGENHGLVRSDEQREQLRVMEEMFEEPIDSDDIDPAESILD